METYERIRELRKKHLKLSQTEFGKKLGVSRSVIKNIEANLLARPEQKEPLLKLICKEFTISYEWLTTGKGEMREETIETFLGNLSSRFEISHYAHKVIECYLNLEKEQQQVIEVFFDNLIQSCATSISDESSVDMAIHMLSQNTDKKSNESDTTGYIKEDINVWKEETDKAHRIVDFQMGIDEEYNKGRKKGK